MSASARLLTTRAVLPAVLMTLAVSSPGPAAATEAAPGQWPGFRGSRTTGISTEPVFSARESFRLTTAWKRPLGSGYSGVAVAGELLVTMFSDGEKDWMVGLDEAAGLERWRYDIDSTYAGHDGSHTGPISTPLIAGARVFGLSPRGRLFALETGTGAELWSADLVQDHAARKPHYGFATSPILQEGILVVETGGKGSSVSGFDPATGKRLWTAGSDGISYQSPIPLTFHGRRQILAAGNKQLTGLDARTGQILWEYAHQGDGPRGALSLVPVPAGDGRLFLAHKDDASTLLHLGQKDGVLAVEPAWESRAIHNSYNVPVYHDGYIYGFSSRILTCVDAATGAMKWRSRQPGDGFLILVDGHLVIITKKGSLHVVKARPEGYQEVAALPLFADLAWSPPSFAGGHIYLRSLGEIARVDIRSRAGRSAGAPSSGPRATGRFAAFLKEAGATADKKALVDRFMASVETFPLVEGRQVTFLYRGQGQDLAVAGDLFGARQEQPMTRLAGTDLFYYATRLESDARSNYLFIRDYQEMLDPLNPRRTTTTVFGKEMEMSFSGTEMEMSWMAMPNWRPPAYLSAPGPGARGRLETRELESTVLKARHTIHVYLPAGYDDGSRRYPAVYVHGGGPAQTRGELPRSLDHLLGRSVEPAIVIFIHQVPRGPADPYARMIAHELIPYVDENFRTIANPDARANVGQGFAGYSAAYCTFKYPGRVGQLAIQSLFMFDFAWKELRPLIKTAAEQPLTVYVDWGTYDLRNPDEAWDLARTNREFARTLAGKGYMVSGGEVHDGTGWSSWRNRTDRVFQGLFPLGGRLQSMQPDPSPADPAAAGRGQAAPEIDLDGLNITNMRRPAADLLTGGQLTREQMAALAGMGYTTFVNLRPAIEEGTAWEEEYADRTGLHFLRIPVSGAADLNRENVELLARTLAQARTRGKAAVYCKSGNRAGALLALKAYWMDGMGAEEALQLGQKAGLTRLEPAVKKILGLGDRPGKPRR
ncbi:MAG: PQQ-binding-like beta-propeller repeat protein [Acidobacteriota bacterium]